MTLYELEGEYLDLEEVFNNPDANEEEIKASLEAMGGEIEEKIEGYLKKYENLKGTSTALNDEINRLQEKKRENDEEAENIRKNVLTAMQILDKNKVETDLFTVSVNSGRPSVVVDDEEEIPEEFFIPQPSKLDKSALKTYLESDEGSDCEGAHLERNPFLMIK